jgi:predicted Zn finger-like uncharacterized protein
MDVRCEKCQTEYELDESRLKPGGVTVKCTNCGHMFKIRKRAATNVGVPAAAASTPSGPTAAPPPEPPRPRAPSKQPRPETPSPDSVTDVPSGPMTASGGDRQWLVRLENGEQKTCKELATLQQWIVAGVVSRESLISRTGKTWKRLGDITELTQYFVIADEARNVRSDKPTGKAAVGASTVLGFGTQQRPPSEDDLERRVTGNFQRPRQPTPPPPPPAAAKATQQAAAPAVNPMGQTELAPSGPIPTQPQRRPPTEPPPAPKSKQAPLAVPPGRGTAVWAQGDIKATDSMASMPQGPRGGKLSASPDEPQFAGRVRIQPGTDAAFKSGQIGRAEDDDDEAYPARRGSRAGMWIALLSLLVIGAAAGVVYMFVFKQKDQVAQPAATGDAGMVAAADAMTSVVVTPIDGGVETPADPLGAARAELLAGVNARMKSSLEGLSGKDDPASLAMRARLSTGLAQAMTDRAGFVDKAEGDKLRKAAKQMVVDTAPLAQRAFNGQQDSASANLAMADVMRMQGKAAPAVKRYIDGARGKAGGDAELLASVALSDALLAMRDGNLPVADKALAAVNAPDDMRVKLARAQIAHAQNKQADAKALVDQVIATQPDNDVALALYRKLETVVAKDDPLPPEDGSASTKPPTNPPTNPPNTGGGGGGGGGGGNDYDSVLAKANKLAETSCAKAMDLYSKALEQKPNGVEALTGMGYCHLDAKQFSSAFSKFRAALFVSSRYEPALGGVAETYQRQGNKEAAIEAWRKYLELYPASAKAKKQLEILGASPDGAPAGGDKKPEGGGDKKPEGGGDGSSAPTPTPAPTPPAPEGSASG